MIRNAKPGDADSIYKMVCELENNTFERNQFDMILFENLSSNANIYLVAADEKEDLQGFISCHGQRLLHHGGWVYEVQEMFVSPAFRGRGIGAALWKDLENRLNDRDHDSLEVTMNQTRSSQKFYESMGLTYTHVKFTKKKAG